MRDCIFLLADKTMEACFSGYFSRDNFNFSLGISQFEFDPRQDIIVNSGGNDPGVYETAHELLRPFINSHQYAVIVLDEEWEGSPGQQMIITDINRNMVRNGWARDRFVVIVIRPELESWIWQDNRNVEEILRHRENIRLREYLSQTGQWPIDSDKPSRPKETLEWVLKRNGVPFSSVPYRRIAEVVSIRNCTDNEFHSFVGQLRIWFPQEA